MVGHYWLSTMEFSWFERFVKTEQACTGAIPSCFWGAKRQVGYIYYLLITQQAPSLLHGIKWSKFADFPLFKQSLWYTCVQSEPTTSLPPGITFLCGTALLCQALFVFRSWARVIDSKLAGWWQTLCVDGHKSSYCEGGHMHVFKQICVRIPLGLAGMFTVEYAVQVITPCSTMFHFRRDGRLVASQLGAFLREFQTRLRLSTRRCVLIDVKDELATHPS